MPGGRSSANNLANQRSAPCKSPAFAQAARGMLKVKKPGLSPAFRMRVSHVVAMSTSPAV